MNDTPIEIVRKQFEIISSKPLKERLHNLFEMTELSRRIIQNRIIENNPEISDVELKVETFKIFYRDDFDKDTITQIASGMRQYLREKKNESSVRQ